MEEKQNTEEAMQMERNEVYLIHGTDYKKMTETLLEHMDLQAQIGSRDQTVALKPNLVLAADPSEGATTHPEIVAGILEYLQVHGFRKIKVIEGSWVGDRTSLAVQVTGLQAVCDRFHVPFYDLQKDSSREYDAKGVRIKICDQAMSTEYPGDERSLSDDHHLCAQKCQGSDSEFGKTPVPHHGAPQTHCPSERGSAPRLCDCGQYLRRPGF